MPPSSEEAIAQATVLLKQLTPAEIACDEAKELRAAGVALFGRLAIKHAYGDKEVVEFLREQAGHRTLLKRLERLQKQINAEHERRCADSHGAGINKARERTMKEIEEASAAAAALEGPPDAAAISLVESWQASDAACDALVVAPGPNPAVATGVPPRLPPRASIDAAVANAGEDGSALANAARIPLGSFKRACGVCKRSYGELHEFYHRLCPECAQLNYTKRLQTADLRGHVALVTGGRVRSEWHGRPPTKPRCWPPAKSPTVLPMQVASLLSAARRATPSLALSRV